MRASHRTVSEQTPRIFPQQMTEVQFPFTQRAWGKGECPFQQVLIFKVFSGAAGQD
jgi:hypothetical protein